MGRKKIRLEPFSGRKVIFVFTTFTRDIEVHGWSKTFFDREKTILLPIILNARACQQSTFPDVTSQDMLLEVCVLCSLRCLYTVQKTYHRSTSLTRKRLTLRPCVGPGSRDWWAQIGCTRKRSRDYAQNMFSLFPGKYAAFKSSFKIPKASLSLSFSLLQN